MGTCTPLFALPMQRIAFYAYAANYMDIKINPAIPIATPIVWGKFKVSPIPRPIAIVEIQARIVQINPRTIREFLCIMAGIQNKPDPA